MTPAARLRELSSLSASRWAAVFGVSRATYQHWVAGGAAYDAHRDHLLEALALVEDAARRLAGPRAVGDWLLSPVGEGWRGPINMLAAREYDTFRGYLLRLPNGREVWRLTIPPRVRRRLSPEAFDEALARLRRERIGG